MPQQPKCFTTTCNGVAAVSCKGLCMKCYSAAKKWVESGKVTWERLTELGMIKLEKTPFEVELERKLKGPLPEGP